VAEGPDPVATLRSEFATLERAYSPGHHGTWAARRRAELVDGTLVELFGRAGAPPGVALAAVGGYGRGGLLPRSDIDLLLIHGDPDADVGRLADALLYPLWDAGFEVGHAVRTVEGCEQACDRLDAGAAMLDLRHLAGDDRLSADAERRAEGWARRDPGAFVRAILDDASRRAERFGSTAHLLEPELKEGSGGWRDLHSVWLIERAVGRPLEEAGLLRGREREALVVAEEFLTRVRSALHLETGRRSERLLLDHQPGIARAMGFEDEPGLVAIDGLMRALFEHAREVEFLLAAVAGRSLEPGTAPAEAPADAAAVLESLAAEAEAGRQPSPALLDAIEAAGLPADIAWEPRVRAAFARLLRAGERGAASLEILDRLHLLERYLPVWHEVRCRPQRDPYHRFTVDAHLTNSLRAMSRLLAGEGAGEDPVHAEAVKQVSDPVALLLGALLHDIGKTGEGRHVAVGERVVGPILDRIGIAVAPGELVRLMVGRHLLLPDTATRRDLTDENLILDVAAAVGSPERLAALYLLAKADAEATGPAAWTPWRRTLIQELVAKVQHVLERGEMGPELAERLSEGVDRLRDLLRDEPPSDVEAFLRRMPRAYLLSVDPARAARHFATITPPLGANEVRAVPHEGIRAGTHELLVVAQDRPGLLSSIAGSLALAGLSILTAQVFTTEDGAAVDVFEVEGVWEPDVDERRWREFRGTLRRAVEGALSLEHRVGEKRRWYPAPPAAIPLSVAVDPGASDFATVVEIGAADRIGLLYDITRTLAELGLDVHLAKVATYDGRVVDSFYVRGSAGRATIDDPTLASRLESALRPRLDP
jgi:[protein-PII] uridylyltransferase